jgi:hypothetical protein
VFGLVRFGCDDPSGNIACRDSIPICGRWGINNLSPALIERCLDAIRLWSAEFTDNAAGEFADDASVLDFAPKSLVLWIRGAANREEYVRVNDDILLGGKRCLSIHARDSLVEIRRLRRGTS